MGVACSIIRQNVGVMGVACSIIKQSVGVMGVACSIVRQAGYQLKDHTLVLIWSG